MRCPSCSLANEAHATRCGRCGAPLAEAPAWTPEARPALAQAGLLLAYVALSSWLGLTGRFLFFMHPTDALGFVTGIWSASLASDVVFAGGSLATGAGAYLLARRGWTAAGLLVGLAGSWATYAFSWAFLMALGFEVPDVDLVVFVAIFGCVGLLFASLAPVLLGVRDRWVVPEPEPAAVDA